MNNTKEFRETLTKILFLLKPHFGKCKRCSDVFIPKKQSQKFCNKRCAVAQATIEYRSRLKLAKSLDGQYVKNQKRSVIRLWPKEKVKNVRS